MNTMRTIVKHWAIICVTDEITVAKNLIAERMDEISKLQKEINELETIIRGY